MNKKEEATTTHTHTHTEYTLQRKGENLLKNKKMLQMKQIQLLILIIICLMKSNIKRKNFYYSEWKLNICMVSWTYA